MSFEKEKSPSRRSAKLDATMPQGRRAVRPPALLASLHQRTPGGIAAVVGRRHEEFSMTKNVGHVELRAPGASGVAEEHEIEAVGREGRPLVMEAFNQDSFARTVRLH